MKFFIVLSATLVCALAQTIPTYLADSPDVAAAKLAHFEEKAKAAAAVGAAPDYVTSYYLNYYKSLGAIPTPVTVLPSGYLADTPEVAAAKAAHFAEIARAGGHGIAYIPPTAAIPTESAQISVLPSGYLADTPEVAAAKAVHYAELAKAGTPVASIPAFRYAYDYPTIPSYYNYYNPAQITVLPSGYLADTPEVAAAKAAHYAELAKVSYYV